MGCRGRGRAEVDVSITEVAGSRAKAEKEAYFVYFGPHFRVRECSDSEDYVANAGAGTDDV